MEVFVSGKLSTILYKAVCVGSEEQMRAFLSTLLDNSQHTAERPEDIFQLAKQLYISATNPENTIDLRCVQMDGQGQFELGQHDCGLYYAIITYGWEFIFLGANIDAAAEAKRFGIAPERAANYHCDKAGTALNYEVLSDVVCSVRMGVDIDEHWKSRIDEDFKGRKK